jgi:TonB family protein
MRTRVCVALILAVLTMVSGTAFAADEASIAPSCAAPEAPAHVLHLVTPQAPPLAMEQQIGGTVIVSVQLDAQSRVTLATVAQSPSPILNTAALAAARASTYMTVVRSCVSAATTLRVPFVFARDIATGPPPAIAADFLGTWYCTSERNSVVVNAFGRNAFNGPVLVLLGAYVATDRAVFATEELFSERAGITTVSDAFAGRLFVGTSRGWQGNRLVFDGESSMQQTTDPPAASGAPLFERLTIMRTDPQHFTRTYETRGSEQQPWTTTSSGSCSRIAAAS